MIKTLEQLQRSSWITGSPTGIEKRQLHGGYEASRGFFDAYVGALGRWIGIQAKFREFADVCRESGPSRELADQFAQLAAQQDRWASFCIWCASSEDRNWVSMVDFGSLQDASFKNRPSFLEYDNLRFPRTLRRFVVERRPLLHYAGSPRLGGSAQFRLLDRIPVPGHTSYPLRRRFLATIIREWPSVRISLSGMLPSQLPSGTGPDLETALNRLGRHLHSLVLEHRNNPPHVRGPESSRIQQILNHLVDWEQYERENPVIQPLWGRIESRTPVGLSIFWSVGPHGLQDKIGTIADKDVPASLSPIGVGQWFYGAAKCYPNRIEWVEEPHVVPDPTDLEARRALWESLPRVPADEPGCWPLKKK
jgi:hypothetical protein